MGAVKAMAIEAEQAMEISGNATAFRLGLIYAVEQILARQEVLVGDRSDEARAQFQFSSSLVRETTDLICYLQEVSGIHR